MPKEKVVDAAKRVAGPVIEGMGYEVVDVKFIQEGGRWRLQFFIDKPGGITLDDCQAVSREIDTLLEVEDIVAGPYALEVSSPGLDRPLIRPEDYRRFEGSLAKIKTKGPVEGRKTFLGRLGESDGAGFNITIEGDKKVFIEYGQVEKARLEVEF